MSKGKQGYGSTRVALTRKLSRRDEQRTMVGRSRQRQERQERQEQPSWWQRRRTPGQAQ
jgi:hypothetical protein